MTDWLRRRREDDGGFTLIELMVVVLIIAILIAIAIPTFLGARERAQDRAAQSNLRNALQAEKTFYVDNQAYTDTDADLEAIEPTLDWNVAGANQVTASIEAGGNVVCLEATSASGAVFTIADIATGADAGTYYFDSDLAACTGAAAAAGNPNGF
ncbi:MAG TPA: prepilin-type N-terminal cleavage/methylation domain-containing protein [Acidimicrobiales bacterium]|jgi:type IV pilus assembly protein PilA